jgi:excinuclease ABC subunit A
VPPTHHSRKSDISGVTSANKLLAAFRALIDAGGSLVVIEHNLDVIKTADYIIDLGPEGGDAGEYVVATGTPEEIMKVKKSHTGRY